MLNHLGCFFFFAFFFVFFSKVRVGAKEGGRCWEMAVAITCGYGGYLLPLLAAHSSFNLFLHNFQSVPDPDNLILSRRVVLMKYHISVAVDVNWSCMHDMIADDKHGRWFMFNSLWLNDAIWWHRSGLTLAQVMACCLMVPSHYLNQCWLLMKGILLRAISQEVPMKVTCSLCSKITLQDYCIYEGSVS